MSLADVFVADRSLGEAAFVETLPEAVVAAAGLVTRLGDPLTLLVIVAAGYLLANRLGVGVPGWRRRSPSPSARSR
ncbi:hypothetical protein ACFQL0_01970 [Haloplanus litoreus]|uniref:hypothetical protein n=1 Tax=Haloplanus litoreus TaxID=767515 RepID=UPI00360741C6